MATVRVSLPKVASSRHRIASGKLHSKRTPISGALCRPGKVGHYVDPFGNFEGAELRAAVVSQFTLSCFHVRTQNNSWLDILPINGVGLPERCRFEYLRIGQQRRVDIAR
jgi:hypothetical protein